MDGSSGVAWNNQDHVCDLGNESQMINMLQMPIHDNTETKSKNKINNTNNSEENNKYNKSEHPHTL